MKRGRKIAVRLTPGNIGCLSGTLKDVVFRVELHLRVNGDDMAKEARESMETFLKQLYECQGAVEEARFLIRA